MTNFNNSNKPIIVLGMHRSGTSAISGVLSNLGVFMGNSLFKAQKGVNEKGFFENSKVVELNERVFSKILSSWDNPLAANLHLNLPDLSEEISLAKSLLTAEYSDQKYWGIKDPRTSILMPFWHQVFSELEITPFYLIMIRDPMEVYGSLKKRDQFSLEKSLILWVHYTLESLNQAINNEYHILSYKSLMAQPSLEVTNLTKKYAIELVPQVEKASSFISAKLRNHKNNESPIDTKDKIGNIATRVFSLSQNTKLQQQELTELNQEFKLYIASLTGVVSEHLSQVKADEVHFRTLFNDAYYTIWWKLSWPLRYLEKKLIK